MSFEQKTGMRFENDLDGSEELETTTLNHLDWSNKQARILTGGGKAEEYYKSERGFPYKQEELPHYYLMHGNTSETFKEWRSSKEPCSIISGCWRRPLFAGGWEFSTDREEYTFNLQTNNLFVDLRIPRSRNQLLNLDGISSFDDLSPSQLTLYARQHIFAGFSVFGHENGRPLCTRHHCIDWNFVGSPRTRPNKWWIEINDDATKWKEFSYATDENYQHYYFEIWQRLPTASEPRLAFRKVANCERDGVLVIVGDHFNYAISRKLNGREKSYSQVNLVGLVDEAVQAGDVSTARLYLSIEGGHGRISKEWELDCAIPPWHEGSKLWKTGDANIEGNSINDFQLVWNNERWDVYDCSFDSLDKVRCFLFGA